MAGTKSPSHRAYVSDVTISVGPMEVVGDIIPPKVANADKAEAFKSICPECAEAYPVKQQYVCTEDATHGPFAIGDCAKAQEHDGVFVRVSADEVADARASVLPPKQLILNVHSSADLHDSVLESGNSYVFRPKSTGQFYGVLLDFLAKNTDLVFVGEVNLRGKDKLVKIERGLNNQLLLVELVWPEDLKEFEAPTYEYKDSLLTMTEKLLTSIVTPFDPEEYHKDSRDRIAALVEATKNGEEAPVTKSKPKASSDDNLEAMLEAALAATGTK